MENNRIIQKLMDMEFVLYRIGLEENTPIDTYDKICKLRIALIHCARELERMGD